MRHDLAQPLEAPDSRLVEVRANQHRRCRQRHEHDAGRTLRHDRLAAERGADRAIGQDERLLLNVAVDVIDEETGFDADLGSPVARTDIEVDVRLRIDLVDRPPVETAVASAVLPTNASRPSRSGDATSNPEPVSPSVPRSVMCGAR